MNQKQFIIFTLTIFISILLISTSCKKGDNGLTSLINLTEEPPGDNCITGGHKIETGIDSNENGVLDITEVQQTEFICNGGGGSVIKELRFRLSSGFSISHTEGWVYSGDLIKFNILNYSNVDSVVLIVDGAVSDSPDNHAIFELIDLTNNKIIENSEVKTNSTDKIRLISPNLISNIPKEEIDLGIKIKITIEGEHGKAEGAYLFLYFATN